MSKRVKVEYAEHIKSWVTRDSEGRAQSLGATAEAAAKEALGYGFNVWFEGMPVREDLNLDIEGRREMTESIRRKVAGHRVRRLVGAGRVAARAVELRYVRECGQLYIEATGPRGGRDLLTLLPYKGPSPYETSTFEQKPRAVRSPEKCTHSLRLA